MATTVLAALLVLSAPYQLRDAASNEIVTSLGLEALRVQQPAEYDLLPPDLKEPSTFWQGAKVLDDWSPRVLRFAKAKFLADPKNAEPASSILGTFRAEPKLQFHLICAVDLIADGSSHGIAFNLQNKDAYPTDLAHLAELIKSFTAEQRTAVARTGTMVLAEIPERQRELVQNTFIRHGYSSVPKGDRLRFDFQFKAYVRDGKAFHETNFARASQLALAR